MNPLAPNGGGGGGNGGVGFGGGGGGISGGGGGGVGPGSVLPGLWHTFAEPAAAAAPLADGRAWQILLATS